MRIEATDSFSRWINGLRDIAGRARIQARIERLADGNPGQHRMLTGGVAELKIDVGPGYRVYYVQRGTFSSCCWQAAKKVRSKKTSRLPWLWPDICRRLCAQDQNDTLRHR